LTTSKTDMKGEVTKESIDSPVHSIPKFVSSRPAGGISLSNSEIPSTATVTNATEVTPTAAKRNSQLRLEAMKQEIIERVSHQAELKKQRVMKAQIQKGLLPGPIELRSPPFVLHQAHDLGGSAIHKVTNSNLLK